MLFHCSTAALILLTFFTASILRSRRGADRAAFKNRWNTVQERVHRICHTRKHSPKPSLEECVAILDEAASLPSPEQAPGGATESSPEVL